MSRMLPSCALVSALALSPAASPATDVLPLEVQVEGVRNGSGELGVAVFVRKTGFPEHLEHAYEAAWVTLEPGQTAVVVRFESLPVGTYALSILHDENGNRKLDHNAQGLPDEGVGFSNQARVTGRSPRFEDARFEYFPDTGSRVAVQLDYSAGRQAPGPASASPLPPADAPGLEVRVNGIKRDHGEIGIALFNTRKGYPIGLEHAFESRWVKVAPGQDSVVVLFDAIPPGEYAVSVFHDENGNRTLESSAVGFPKEGVGFSNGQRVTFRAPRFRKSKLSLLPGEQKRISIDLRYRDGPGGFY